MSKKNDRTPRILLAVLLVVFSGMSSRGQATQDVQNLPEAQTASTHSIEDLNYLGGDAAMPLFSDSMIDVDSKFRQALFSKGLALRVISQAQYVQNLLDSPVPADEQVYVGQRPFEGALVQPILTADLRQLHLRQSQLYIGAVWNWVSWNPAGPKSLQLWDLYFCKSFGENRGAIKAGYLSNQLDFVGFYVGGSIATGAQGVYAVLPYEVGMSYFPLTTPSFNVQIQGPKKAYFKAAAQRSLDPKGGPTEVQRNRTGFRFIPHGDKLLSINEGGFLRQANTDAHESWFRAGYMYNFTKYSNAATRQSDSGNYCAYALMDYQLTQSNRYHPNNGWYVGASAETASKTLNPYAHYYEARLYKEAARRSRPADVLSVVASRTNYSRYFSDHLASDGKTVWRGGTTLTASYSLRASPGSYLGLGLSYLYGPAITPRVPNALKFTATWTTYF